jgi:molybdopterin molybdotransferase
MSSNVPDFERASATVAAYARDLGRLVRPSIESVALQHASRRILAQPLLADEDQPPFARSTRDGYACRAAETSSHSALPIAGATHAGEAPAGPLPNGAAWEIMTGAPVPAGADAVVMLEHVERAENTIRLLPSRQIEPGDNIVAQGAQARKGDVLLAAGAAIGPAQIALAASCGYAAIEVFARPRVAILTTGDELVAVNSAPGPGQIRNSNSPMLAALVESAGGDPWVLPNAADTAEALDAALAHTGEADLLLISGGVSAGKYDLVEPALARMGARFHFTGVRIQPGKPLVFGEVSRIGAKSPNGSASLPFFGLPGNPISSAATFLLFAAPVLGALAGSRDAGPRFALATLARDTDRPGKPGLTRFLPAWCNFKPSTSDHPYVETIPWHGSGDLAAFARSNCFLVVPEEASFIEAGSVVRILLL